MAAQYKRDLAFIHDAGFADWARNAAPFILERLNRPYIRGELVIDLGCGSGVLAKTLVEGGHSVLGIDLSKEMIRIARESVPKARFKVGSLFAFNLPRCGAVVSTGECINYLFDSGANLGLNRVFRNVFAALMPGGVFIFDIAEPGQLKGRPTRSFTEGDDWVVLVAKEEEKGSSILTRRIVTFRKVGQVYRKSEEIHRQQLYRSTEVAAELRNAGFRVRTLRSYGDFELPSAHAVFVARKPG